MRIKWAVTMETESGNKFVRNVRAKTRDIAMSTAEMRYNGTAYDAIPCC